ncbi:MAG: hypothetical protein ACKO7B_05480 [Flavobacteriales bacterium]
MGVLSNRNLRTIDQKVIIDADDATPLLEALKVKAIAVKGKED